MAVQYYTDIQSSRKEAGFENNGNITDELILDYVQQAHGIVQGYVAAVYKLENLQPGTNLFDYSQAAAFLKRAATLYSGGFLLQKQYGLEERGTERDGAAKIAEADKMLALLIRNPNPMRLVDSEGNEFGRVSSQNISGIIRSTGIEEGSNQFSKNMKF